MRYRRRMGMGATDPPESGDGEPSIVSVGEFRKDLLERKPLDEYRGTAGTVSSFVSSICTSADQVDLTVAELIALLRRRLAELAVVVEGAKGALEDAVAEYEKYHADR